MTGVQTCALPISHLPAVQPRPDGPDRAVLEAHLPATGQASGPRSAALRLLAWLRSLPVLSGPFVLLCIFAAQN